MATEAQRLIGISLAKIAQSRVHRGGVSLHKNLLVATVLQKARYIFMEEAYHMVHGSYGLSAGAHVPQPQQQRYSEPSGNYEEDGLVALTAEEAGLAGDSAEHDAEQAASRDGGNLEEYLQPSCSRCAEPRTADKENCPSYLNTELTYIDLDKSSPVPSGNNAPSQGVKRRRAVTEWETEEAVLSILPKRTKPEAAEDNDSVFLDEAVLLSDCVAREVAAAEEAMSRSSHDDDNANDGSSAMEIDRITSLVSIFSFGGLAAAAAANNESLGKLSRSVSTPDLCSAQAKDGNDALQQRPFIAMTV